jgi:hypothetical protein
MYPDKKKDIEVIKALKEKKFIDADMADILWIEFGFAQVV